jgi:cupin fold WbuC family metalloprotein
METVSLELVRSLSTRAADLPRLRTNLNLHPTLDDPVQRLFNAMEPGTYVRPHRHLDAGRWEVFVCLSGRAVVLTFDDDGTVRERCFLGAEGPTVAVEIAPGAWHTLSPLESGTVFFEVKPGPYVALTDKDFAPWAPAEGEAGWAAFVSWFLEAVPGDRPPQHPRG